MSTSEVSNKLAFCFSQWCQSALCANTTPWHANDDVHLTPENTNAPVCRLKNTFHYAAMFTLRKSLKWATRGAADTGSLLSNKRNLPFWILTLRVMNNSILGGYFPAAPTIPNPSRSFGMLWLETSSLTHQSGANYRVEMFCTVSSGDDHFHIIRIFPVSGFSLFPFVCLCLSLHHSPFLSLCHAISSIKYPPFMPENDGRHHDNSITALKKWESQEGRMGGQERQRNKSERACR